MQDKISVNSPIRYPGGKFRARKILDSYLPKEELVISSPFLGGGSFELYATGNGHTVLASDGFKQLSNFWTYLLSDPESLGSRLYPYLNEVDSEKFKDMQERQKNNSNPSTIEDAVEFIIVNRCSFSGATFSGGYSKESASTRFTKSVVDKIKNFSNDKITVEHGFFEDMIPKYSKKSDLLFLDPPYLLDGTKNSLYGIGGNMHKHFDHFLLKEVVKESKKPFILTYNNNEIIKEMWKEYKIEEAEWSYGMNKTKKSSEIIITNY